MAEIEKGKPRPANDCYRIIVLNENAEQMAQIKAACKNLGQEVVGVTTIEEGIAFLETKDHVDVVISEAYLQNESVFDFLRELKKMPEHTDVPVILMAVSPGETGIFALATVEELAKVMGAFKFVYYDIFDVNMLMNEIKAALPEDRPPLKETLPGGNQSF